MKSIQSKNAGENGIRRNNELPNSPVSNPDDRTAVRQNKQDYSKLKSKLLLQLCSTLMIAFLIAIFLHRLFWSSRCAEWIVSLFQSRLHISYPVAVHLYEQTIRSHADLLELIAIILLFFMLLRLTLNRFIRYFVLISQGIDALLTEKDEIKMPPEMRSVEHKLNSVRQILKQHTMEAALSEQRKDDLVLYLAHDIRTPLTSVIGYLSLLEEAPDMPAGQRAKYLHITFDKALRLEKMVNEFFEITRCSLQKISLKEETIDLYYMLVQLTDELSSALSANGNITVLEADENLTIYGDPEKLARVFSNILKNAVAYSRRDTEIRIAASEESGAVTVTFQNRGDTIPPERLSAIFEKFFRLDEARASNTGGAGLGLAIAKEIVTAHGGTISALSENGITSFSVTLPGKESAAQTLCADRPPEP